MHINMQTHRQFQAAQLSRHSVWFGWCTDDGVDVMRWCLIDSVYNAHYAHCLLAVQVHSPQWLTRQSGWILTMRRELREMLIWECIRRVLVIGSKISKIGWLNFKRKKSFRFWNQKFRPDQNFWFKSVIKTIFFFKNHSLLSNIRNPYYGSMYRS